MAAPRNNAYTGTAGSTLYAGQAKPLLVLGNRRVTIWGQSNARGRADVADISASPLSSDAGLATLYGADFDRVYIWTGSAYAKLRMGTNNVVDAGQFGPEFGLAVRWMRETASGNLYLHKAAESGTSITYWHKTDTWHYGTELTAWNNGTAWLSGQGVTATDGGFLYVQGEADAGQTQSWYQTRLEEILANRIADGMQTPTSQRLIVQMLPGTAQYGAGVAAAKTAIAAAASATTQQFPMANYIKADNLHLNGRGQVQLGYDTFERLFGADHINA